MVDNEMDGYMEFFYQFGKDHPAVSVRLSPASALPEVLETFEGFLRVAGYHFGGQLDFVDVNDAIEPHESEAELN